MVVRVELVGDVWVINILEVINVGDHVLQIHSGLSDCSVCSKVEELVNHLNEVLQVNTRSSDLILSKRPEFPVYKWRHHIDSSPEENVEDCRKASLSFFLCFVVHDPGIDYIGNVFQELIILVELFEIGDQGGYSEPSEDCRRLTEDLG